MEFVKASLTDLWLPPLPSAFHILTLEKDKNIDNHSFCILQD